jgi:hypothetical protein
VEAVKAKRSTSVSHVKCQYVTAKIVVLLKMIKVFLVGSLREVLDIVKNAKTFSGLGRR